MNKPLFEFWAPGIPAPQGSKSFRGMHAGHAVMTESSKKVKPWRRAVEDAAKMEIADQIERGTWATLDGPLELSILFYLPRPKRTKYKDLPAGVPDLSKLVRSTEDALTTAGVWADDGRVTSFGRIRKRWVGDPIVHSGALIEICRDVDF